MTFSEDIKFLLREQ